MAIAVTTCAASLSLAACSAGITTLRPAATGSRAPSPAGSMARPSPSASPSPNTADTFNVGGLIGSFPVPPGAQLVGNLRCGKQVLLEFGSVVPSRAASFYSSALPRAGYTITTTMASGIAQGMAEFQFTGHGYTGQITAVANLKAEASAAPSTADLPTNLTSNFLEITLSQRGWAGTADCPNLSAP